MIKEELVMHKLLDEHEFILINEITSNIVRRKCRVCGETEELDVDVFLNDVFLKAIKRTGLSSTTVPPYATVTTASTSTNPTGVVLTYTSLKKAVKALKKSAISYNYMDSP